MELRNKILLENLRGEIWKVIVGYEDYHVSNFGRVKSFKYNEPRIMPPSLNAQGYLFVNLSKDAKQKIFLVSRLVAQAFIPNPQNKPQVDHVFGMKFDNSVENLRWATSSENTRYAYEAGLKLRKLTNEQALYIRGNPDNLTRNQLAEKFGICETKISAIQLGRTYKNAGGMIHQSKFKRLPDEVREEIRGLYVKGSKEFGSVALGKKFGVNPTTIWKIIQGR